MPQHSAFPFDDAQYHRVEFVDEPYGPMKVYKDPRDETHVTGVMVFRRSTDISLSKVMEVFVTGDTAINMYSLVNNIALDRPMVHDVMFWIVQQAQSTDPSRWGLLRVAIVGLKDDVYVARLFFGDLVTGEVTWDCDCRPSDACFLSIKLNAPLYILKSVWDAAAKRLEKSTVHQMVMRQVLQTGAPSTSAATASSLDQPQHQFPSGQAPGGAQEQEQPSAAPSKQQQQPIASASSALEKKAGGRKSKSTEVDYTTLLQDDLEPIKRLKRELAVAIQEEDYATAARLRDHPFMKVYREMWMNRLLGHQRHAELSEERLKEMIERTM